MPRTKQIESRIFDFPLPFRPVMALNMGSKPSTTVRLAYDCKHRRAISKRTDHGASTFAKHASTSRHLESINDNLLDVHLIAQQEDFRRCRASFDPQRAQAQTSICCREIVSKMECYIFFPLSDAAEKEGADSQGKKRWKGGRVGRRDRI
eukprot:2423956-Rhodomonas_salina.2